MFEMSEHVYVFHVAYKSANNQSMLLPIDVTSKLY